MVRRRRRSRIDSLTARIEDLETQLPDPREDPNVVARGLRDVLVLARAEKHASLLARIEVDPGWIRFLLACAERVIDGAAELPQNPAEASIDDLHRAFGRSNNVPRPLDPDAPLREWPYLDEQLDDRPCQPDPKPSVAWRPFLERVRELRERYPVRAPPRPGPPQCPPEPDWRFL